MRDEQRTLTLVIEHLISQWGREAESSPFDLFRVT